MPERAIGKGGELCSGLSTAASRWRPRGSSELGGGAWHGRGRHSAKPRAVGKLWGDTWAPARSEGRPGGLSTAPATGSAAAAEKNRGEGWRKEKRAGLQFLKISGTKL